MKARCNALVTRGNLDVAGITLAGGTPQGCGEKPTQRIVTPNRISFRCAAHEVVADEDTLTFPIGA